MAQQDYAPRMPLNHQPTKGARHGQQTADEAEAQTKALTRSPVGRTRLGNETIEIAFMLLCFLREGAPIDKLLEVWARKTLAQNGELRPDQVEGLA